MTARELMAALDAAGSPAKAKASAWFFKTGPGQYGEGDVFAGLKVPEVRAITKPYHSLPLGEVEKLLASPVHEHRLAAMFILVYQFQHGDPDTQETVASFYHKHRSRVNNWDLVDSSAPIIMGGYLTNHSRNVLTRLAASKSVWERRIAVVSTFGWIRAGDFDWTCKLCEQLMGDKHDLIHKACGWMLREVGKQDRAALLRFLDAHAAVMPRTMLRYSLEHLPPDQRAHYMAFKR